MLLVLVNKKLSFFQTSLNTLRPSFYFTNYQVICALDIDFSDLETQVASIGILLGTIIGIGSPIFYASRDKADEKRVEEIRSLNRATKEATGEFMSEAEIYSMRPPRWTDKRDFVDND